MKSTTTYMFTGENISDGESFEIVRTKDLDYMTVCGACTHWLLLMHCVNRHLALLQCGVLIYSNI